MTSTPAPKSPPRRPPRTIGGIPVALVVGLVAVIALGMWWQWRSQQPSAAPVAPAETPPFEVLSRVVLERPPGGPPGSRASYETDLALVPDGSVYALWLSAVAPGGSNARALKLARSTDRGVSFAPALDLPLPQGHLYAAGAKLAVSPEGAVFAVSTASGPSQSGGAFPVQQLAVFHVEAEASALPPVRLLDWESFTYGLQEVALLAEGDSLLICQGGFFISPLATTSLPAGIPSLPGIAPPLPNGLTSALSMSVVAPDGMREVPVPAPFAEGCSGPVFWRHERGVSLIATVAAADGKTSGKYRQGDLVRVDLDASYAATGTPTVLAEGSGDMYQIVHTNVGTAGSLTLSRTQIDTNVGLILEQLMTTPDAITGYEQSLQLWQGHPDGSLTTYPPIRNAEFMLGLTGQQSVVPSGQGWLKLDLGFDQNQFNANTPEYRLLVTYLDGSTVAPAPRMLDVRCSPFSVQHAPALLTWDDGVSATLLPVLDPQAPGTEQLSVVRFGVPGDD